jgi:hypothetical protein
LTASHDFMWSFIAIPFIVVSWISHAIAYPFTKRSLRKKFFESLGHRGGWNSLFKNRKRRKEQSAAMGSYAPLYEEAYRAKEAILSQIAKSGDNGPVGTEISPQLEEYVEQVKLLSISANEIDNIIEAIPMKALDTDKAVLQGKLADTGSESLKYEYQKSIDEIDKQEKAYKDLGDQREVLNLRLKSSVNALKQMQLDIARLRTLPNAGGQAAMDTIKHRTDELQHYLDDMRRGYADVQADPYAELERIVSERERQEKLPSKPEDDSTNK